MRLPLYTHLQDMSFGIAMGRETVIENAGKNGDKLKENLHLITSFMPESIAFDVSDIIKESYLINRGKPLLDFLFDMNGFYPPYPVSFFEWEEYFEDGSVSPYGCLLLTQRREQVLIPDNVRKDFWHIRSISAVNPREDTQDCRIEVPVGGAKINIAAFYLENGRLSVCPAKMIIGIDNNGNFIRMGNKISVSPLLYQDPYEEPASELETTMSSLFSVSAKALLCCTFLNCKNITTKDNYPPRQERRARERAGKPSIIWKTLDVQVPPRASTPSDKALEESAKRRLHLVRGHFAEYGPEFGKGKLFGKLSGRYWIPPMVRGSEEAGAVIKDYRLKNGHAPTIDNTQT